MCSEAKLHELIGLVYESILDPGKWSDFLRLICEELDATAAHLPLQSHRGTLKLSSVSHGLARKTLEDWQRPETRDPWAHGVLFTGQAGFSHHVCPDHELVKTRFYDEILVPANLFYGAVLVILFTPDTFALLALLRPRDRGPFDQRTLQVLHTLFPHLNRAARIQSVLQSATGELEVSAAALDSVSFPMVVVDGTGQVLLRNENAVRMMQAGPLGMVAGRVRATYPDDSRRLKEAIAQAARASEEGRSYPATSILLQRRRGEGAVVVMVSALRTGKPNPFVLPMARVMLMLHDLSSSGTPSMTVMRDLFSFTPTECEIAAALHDGMTLKEIAHSRGSSAETIRNHTKHMLQKSGTRRQAELVRLLSRLAWQE